MEVARVARKKVTESEGNAVAYARYATRKQVELPQEDAAIYARYSSHMQNDASIEQQVEECREYARTHNLRIVEVYADRALSGRNDKRPEFQKMLRHAEAGKFRVVLSYKSNRIARNMLHALSYEDKLAQMGVRVVYAKEEFGDNAAGRFALRTMMNVNQFYSENMAEDIKRGLMDAAMQCKVVSMIPLGYRKGADGKYEIDENEAAIVREIFQRVAAGESYAAIADDLNARKISTKHGKTWGKNSFRVLLSNERYIGVYLYGDLRIENGMPVIIEKELFNTVQHIVAKKPTKVNGRRRDNGDYLLTGKLFCGYCESPMVGVSGTSKTGILHHYYACQKQRLEKACHKKIVRRDWAERMVTEALMAYVLNDESIEWIADMVMSFKKKFIEEDSQIDYLEERLSESMKASENIMKAIEAGIFNNKTQERMLELEAEQRDLNSQLTAERALIPNVNREQIVYWLQSLRNGNAESRTFQAKLFDIFLLRVYLYDDHVKFIFNWDKENSGVEIPMEATSDDDPGACDNASCVRIESPRLHEPKSLEMQGFRLFSCCCIPTPYPQTLSFPYPRKTAMRSILRFLQRANELFHLGCRVLRHPIADVTVGVEREGNGCVSKG